MHVHVQRERAFLHAAYCTRVATASVLDMGSSTGLAHVPVEHACSAKHCILMLAHAVSHPSGLPWRAAELAALDAKAELGGSHAVNAATL